MMDSSKTPRSTEYIYKLNNKHNIYTKMIRMFIDSHTKKVHAEWMAVYIRVTSTDHKKQQRSI